MKILVAMSGGVDSSVVAHLLKQEGHELVGVMMKLWVDPLAPPIKEAIPTKCCSVEHIQRARTVCESLEIPFYVLNLEDYFKQNVVDPFLKDYENGLTPNPCIECNRTIKFGVLLDKAKELGCDLLATGHYARVVKKEKSAGSVTYLLLEAMDTQKDQSYYLYSLDQQQLSQVLFPLGSKTKQDVYALAQKFGVPLKEDYRESQDLCFYPEREPEAFLRRNLKDVKGGPIKLLEGETVGRHKGLPFYTIGQRKGLGIGGLKIPLHVVKKEQKSNTIFVAPSGADLESKLQVFNLQWVSWHPRKGEEIRFDARISSLGTKHPGTLSLDESTSTFNFDQGVRGVAPGQSVVFYSGEEVVGGGVICS